MFYYLGVQILVLNGVTYQPLIFRENTIMLFTKSNGSILLAIGATAFLMSDNTNFLVSVFPCQTPMLLLIFGFIECFPLFHIYCFANFMFTFVLYYVMSTKYWLRQIR